MSEQEIQNRIVGIIGHKGTGKTTKLIEILESSDRLLLVDIKGEHEWLPNELHSIAELREFFRWNRKRAQWAATFVPGEDIEEEIVEVAGICYERGKMTLGLEEVSEYTRPNYIPKRLRRIVLLGRNKEIDVVWTVQRFAEASRTLTSQTDEYFFFLQTEPKDLDAIAERSSAEIADEVRNLGKHDWIHWDKISRQVIDRSKSPSIASVASKSEPAEPPKPPAADRSIEIIQ